MNQLCKVCGEPAAGFHFGAFTCEGCKSFFGRTYNNISAIAGCKNNGDCVINKKNRTACKACRLRKCLLVGMSKSGSRYGRRSNWFKIHCLLQEQQTTGSTVGGGGAGGGGGGTGSGTSINANSFEQLARLHQMQARQTYQDKTNPCIKSASMSPTTLALNASASSNTPTSTPPNLLSAAAKFLNGVDGNHQHHTHHHHLHHHQQHQHQHQLSYVSKVETRLSDTPSDSGASSAGDAADDANSSVTSGRQERNCSSAHHPVSAYDEAEADARARRHKQLLQIYRSHSEPLRSPFANFALSSNLPPPALLPTASGPTPPPHMLPAALKEEIKRVSESVVAAAVAVAASSGAANAQDEPIDLSLKTQNSHQRRDSSQSTHSGSTPTPATTPLPADSPTTLSEALANVIQKQKTTPLDLTLVRTQTLTG